MRNRSWPPGFRQSLVPEAGRRVWSRTGSFAFFGWVRADGPAFLKSAPAGTRTWHGGSSHAAHVRRPTDGSPHPVVTQTSRSTTSVGSIATVIGHQHHCATSKIRAARWMPVACRSNHSMRVDCMSAMECPQPKGCHPGENCRNGKASTQDRAILMVHASVWQHVIYMWLYRMSCCAPKHPPIKQ